MRILANQYPLSTETLVYELVPWPGHSAPDPTLHRDWGDACREFVRARRSASTHMTLP